MKSAWTSAFKSLVFPAFGHPRSVFLDAICVDQHIPRNKALAIMSIGAFLKNSKTLFLMWDATVCQRLWCMFELAAFLRSRENTDVASLVVRPTMLGPCACSLAAGMSVTMGIMYVIDWNDLMLAVLVFSGWALFGFSITVAAFRHYFESVRVMRKQMETFQVSQSMCYCCEHNHRGADGRQLSCDREILGECVRRWFGSTEDFEKRLQSSISEALALQLGRQAFPYRWLLGATSPILWGEMDLFASEYRARHDPTRIYSTIIIFGWWLGGFPILFAWTLFLSKRCCQPVGSRFWDTLQTMAVALYVFPLYMALFAYQIFLEKAWPNPIPGAVLFAATTPLAALLAWQSRGQLGCYSGT